MAIMVNTCPGELETSALYLRFKDPTEMFITVSLKFICKLRIKSEISESTVIDEYSKQFVKDILCIYVS